MTWYADLQRGCMAGGGDDARAIGWLGRDYPYPTGPVSSEFLEVLGEHVEDPWMSIVIMGIHTCELCVESPAVRDYRNLFIPTVTCVYIAPAMVRHYVADHGYRPPDEFVEAVLRCPRQGSDEYRSLIEPFLDRFDGLHFDRAWEAKREAAFKRAQEWTRRGMCPRCEYWQYLFPGDAAVHCGVPLVHVEDRAGSR